MYIIFHLKDGKKIASRHHENIDIQKIDTLYRDVKVIYIENPIPLEEKELRDSLRVYQEPWKLEFLNIYTRKDRPHTIALRQENIVAIQYVEEEV